MIPAQARKKTISEAGGIQWIYGVLAEAEVADNTLEPESGAQVTSFRFCLSGVSSFEMAYISHEGKTGELKGKNINYQTPEDVSRLWDASATKRKRLLRYRNCHPYKFSLERCRFSQFTFRAWIYYGSLPLFHLCRVRSDSRWDSWMTELKRKRRPAFWSAAVSALN